MKVDDNIVCEATTLHCCLNTEGKVISLKKVNPEAYELFLSYLTSVKDEK